MKHLSDDTVPDIDSPDLNPGTEGEFVIPVVREEAEIHKAVQKTGSVRIQKTVHEKEEKIRETLLVETAEIERVPKNLLVDTMPSVRTEGEVTVIPVVEEVLVMTKRLRLVEELRVTKRRSAVEHEETVTLLSEEVTVERHNAQQ